MLAGFGADSPSLGTFGFRAPKRTARTSERKVAATLEAKSTRKARRTMSRKQKAKLLGAPAPAAPSESPRAAVSAILGGFHDAVPCRVATRMVARIRDALSVQAREFRPAPRRGNVRLLSRPAKERVHRGRERIQGGPLPAHRGVESCHEPRRRELAGAK